MAFAQLTYLESLRDIESCLRSMWQKLHHVGICGGGVARSTLAEANKNRDWRIFADFAHCLINIARPIHATEPLCIDFDETLYALDATTIDFCLSLFLWDRFRQTGAAVKVHTLRGLRGNIPAFIHISEAQLHEVNVFDEMTPEAGTFYLMDRLYRFTVDSTFFVIRNKGNVILRRSSQKVDKSTGICCDQMVVLDTAHSAARYPDKLRRVQFRDPDTGNNFALPSLTIARIYKCRWQVGLFFKWIKHRLRIKAFYATSENAVKTQIWIAISFYVLAAIVRKRLALKVTLYTFLQVLSLSLFEKTPILRAVEEIDSQADLIDPANQLILVDF